jgi:hypothetical protein
LSQSRGLESSLSAFIRGKDFLDKDFLPAALAPRVRRMAWILGAGSWMRCIGRGSGSGKAPGSRFKGSIRDGLNSAVESGFVAGSRFKGSIREDSNCTAGAWFMGAMRGDSTAVAGSRFEGSLREGLGGTVGSGEAGRDNGRSARTRTPVVRAAVARSGSAGKPAREQVFNAEAQRRRGAERQGFWRFARPHVEAPRAAHEFLLGDRCASAVNPCLLAIEPASGPHHRNAATASGKDV